MRTALRCSSPLASLYRCIQEAVTNALRHGDAHTIRVEVAETGAGETRTLALTVTDDGSGPPPMVVEGLGLGGIRERVRALGGTCRFDRGADIGARLAVTLPVHPRHREAIRTP
ncbi:ATP-binding protein [Xanthobacter sp. KR7-65]|uniref:ATP-binding protein n=1 Tax=Xanthobacter sp. KR7-65 TaxID=3156612 RepID=UPI0032B5438A